MGVNSMLSLGIRPGLIASHTIVINDALSYQIRLSKLPLGPDVYRLDIHATTTLGRLTVSHARYHNFATAQQAFNHQRHQLESH
ncbi:sodium:proton antiporter [Lactiplantibacillus plantarum]|nr:sodium:proton antiporter [Lactiplantibacillus plantarum]